MTPTTNQNTSLKNARLRGDAFPCPASEGSTGAKGNSFSSCAAADAPSAAPTCEIADFLSAAASASTSKHTCGAPARSNGCGLSHSAVASDCEPNGAEDVLGRKEQNGGISGRRQTDLRGGLEVLPELVQAELAVLVAIGHLDHALRHLHR